MVKYVAFVSAIAEFCITRWEGTHVFANKTLKLISVALLLIPMNKRET